jgi:hypothetical protein
MFYNRYLGFEFGLANPNFVNIPEQNRSSHYENKFMDLNLLSALLKSSRCVIFIV